MELHTLSQVERPRQPVSRALVARRQYGRELTRNDIVAHERLVDFVHDDDFIGEPFTGIPEDNDLAGIHVDPDLRLLRRDDSHASKKNDQRHGQPCYTLPIHSSFLLKHQHPSFLNI